MTFPPGTAVGWQGNGLTFSGGYTVTFDGIVKSPCYFVRCNTVQESDQSGDGMGIAGSGQGPTLNATFTRFSAVGDIAPFFDANSLYPYLYNCELWSGLLGGSVNGGLQLYCYNCLFDRSAITFSTTAGSPYSYCYLQNCTLHGGTLTLDNLNDDTYASIYDSAFDGTTIGVDDPYNGNTFNFSYNAYLSGAETLANDSADQIITSANGFNWQQGPLGSFYLPDDPGQNDGTLLLDAGNQPASSISVQTGYNGYQTTLANFTSDPMYQAPDNGADVNIGYHYATLVAYAGNQQLCPNGTLDINQQNSNPDVFGSPLTYSTVTSPTHGSLSGTPSSLLYTPAPCYEGQDNFGYQISDGLLNSLPAT